MRLKLEAKTKSAWSFNPGRIRVESGWVINLFFFFDLSHFAVSWSMSMYSTSFKRSNSHLFGNKSPRPWHDFKHELCWLKLSLFHIIQRPLLKRNWQRFSIDPDLHVVGIMAQAASREDSCPQAILKLKPPNIGFTTSLSFFLMFIKDLNIILSDLPTLEHLFKFLTYSAYIWIILDITTSKNF